MFKKILLGLVAVVVALVGFIATRPSTFSVQRTASLQASPDIAFALVNDFHQWGEWSPWDKLDPSMKRTYEGAASGTGAKYSWIGNDQVGEGQMTIEESKPSELIRIKLEFVKPWPGTSSTLFTFKPEGEAVSVTWKMEGNNDFVGKAFSAFMDMDEMIGKDFEKGLASMKTLAEAEATRRKVAEQKAMAEKAEAEKAEAEAAAAAAAVPAEGSTAAAATP